MTKSRRKREIKRGRKIEQCRKIIIRGKKKGNRKNKIEGKS